MPKNKKADTSDSDSGPEDRLPAKKSKASKSVPKEDEEYSWAIDKRRFIKVREFRGKWMVDIREFYDAEGELKPGKKGIALSLPQWNKLKDAIPEIDEILKKNV